MRSPHSIRGGAVALAAALVGVAWPCLAQPQPSPASATGASNYTVFIRGVPVGSELVGVERTADGWTITGSGRLGPPFDLVTRKIVVRYDEEWRPLELTIDATMRGVFMSLQTTVSDATATSEIVTGTEKSDKSDQVHPESVLLPNPFFAAYEALARRLATAEPGDEIAAYVAPQGSLAAVVGPSSTERIQTLERLIEARRTQVAMSVPGGPPVDTEVWADEAGRLLRLSVPAQGVEVVREDVGAVSTRRVTVSRPGDEQVRIPGNGFSLAGTLSKPTADAASELPAVVLVGGSGPTDRDEVVAGVPILGQLANALADAGFMVLRYDKRGVGQSGGRPESATISDYAEDLRAAVRYLSDRRDVDRRRVAVVGHGEGGAVAMITAERERRVAALVLIAAPGVTGAELNLQQVEHSLARGNAPEEQRQKTLALQKAIQSAVLTGEGWDEIPAALRRQADTPWFQSFLAFDPARLMRDIRQPVLIVQPMLDKQVLPVNADRLEQLASARRRGGEATVVRLEELNHLLVPATTGEVDEYPSLKSREISGKVSSEIAAWLKEALAASR